MESVFMENFQMLHFIANLVIFWYFQLDTT